MSPKAQARIIREMLFIADGSNQLEPLEVGVVVDIVPFGDILENGTKEDRAWAEGLRRRGLHKTVTLIRWKGKVRMAKMGESIERLRQPGPPRTAGPRPSSVPSWAQRKETCPAKPDSQQSSSSTQTTPSETSPVQK